MLAQTMVEIGTRAGRHVSALLTGMNEPLGSHVGNRLEVKEAIEILRGESAGPLLTVSLRLGAQLLIASGLANTAEQGEKMLRAALEEGRGLEKLRQLIRAQVLADAPVIREIISDADGYIAAMDTMQIGYASLELGAGRKKKSDIIDPRVGFIVNARIGDHVACGQPLYTLYAADTDSAVRAEHMLRTAIHLSDHSVPPEKLLYALVTPEGVQTL